MDSVLEYIIKAISGTILFTIILALARSGDPRVTGMMLTFPALNGIGLLAAEPQELQKMAKAMIPMIAINGILCVLYILVYRRLASISFHLKFIKSEDRKAVILAIFCGITWFTFAWILSQYVKDTEYSAFAVAIIAIPVLGAMFLVLRKVLWMPAQAATTSWPGLLPFLKEGCLKILFMFVLICAVMIASAFGDEIAGLVSAFPLLPLFALLTITWGISDAQLRLSKLNSLGGTVLFGPGVAIVFVLLFSHYLGDIRKIHGGSRYLVEGAFALALLWIACWVLILGLRTFFKCLNKTNSLGLHR